MKVFNLLVFLSSFGPVSYAQEQHPVKSKEPIPIQGTLGLLSFWMSRSYREGFKSGHALGQSDYIRMNAKILKGIFLCRRVYVIWQRDQLRPGRAQYPDRQFKQV